MQGNVKYSYNAGKCSCGEKTRREVARGEAPSHQYYSSKRLYRTRVNPVNFLVLITLGGG